LGAPNSIQIIGNKLFYMCLWGLAAFDGRNVQLVTHSNWLKDIDPEYLYSCYGGILLDAQLLMFSYASIGSSGAHNRVLLYDFSKNIITFSDMSFVAYTSFYLSAPVAIGDMTWTIGSDSRTLREAGQPTLTPILLGFSSDGHVFKLLTGTNADGGAITSFFAGGWDNFGSTTLIKKATRIFIVGRKYSNNITLYLYADGDGTTPVVTLAVSMNSANIIVVTQNDLSFSFRHLKYKLVNNDANASFDIQEIIIQYTMTDSTQ